MSVIDQRTCACGLQLHRVLMDSDAIICPDCGRVHAFRREVPRDTLAYPLRDFLVPLALGDSVVIQERSYRVIGLNQLLCANGNYILWTLSADNGSSTFLFDMWGLLSFFQSLRHLGKTQSLSHLAPGKKVPEAGEGFKLDWLDKIIHQRVRGEVLESSESAENHFIIFSTKEPDGDSLIWVQGRNRGLCLNGQPLAWQDIQIQNTKTTPVGPR